jgi:hypothetical protein
VAPGAYPEILIAVVMKGQGIEADIISTQDALAAFVFHSSLFEQFATSGNVVLVFAADATETSLPTRQQCFTQMPLTYLCHSRLLCRLSYAGLWTFEMFNVPNYIRLMNPVKNSAYPR